MEITHITPKECWGKLQEEEMSFLIDVRTTAEWTYVGVPNLATIGKELICVEWLRAGPIQDPNKTFADTVHHYVSPVEEKKGAQPKTSKLYFICRSGQRSLKAAEEMSARGWTHCYNVAEGFEGTLDDDKHFGTQSGWKVAGLPWIQG